MRSFFGVRVEQYFSINKKLFENSSINKLIIINPLLSFLISEEDIIDEIKKYGWRKTKDTGMNSSNCMLNDLGIAVHYKKHGFHPYTLEISEQIRAGLIKREDALKKVLSIPKDDEISWQANKIGINMDEIKK